MELLARRVRRDELLEMSGRMFGGIVKAVVDIERGLVVVDAELHSDQESLLIEHGSKQEDLWGINFYPQYESADQRFLEFDSMINVRPWQDNHSRSVENKECRRRIRELVLRWVE